MTPIASQPLILLHTARRPIYAVAGGNRLTLLLSRDEREPAGLADLGEIAEKWGIEFWTGTVGS